MTMSTPSYPNLPVRYSRYLAPKSRVKATRYHSQIYTTMQLAATNGSHLVLLHFGSYLQRATLLTIANCDAHVF